ncbi:MAG: RHS repeat-associated core domain-containing protein [Myxococcota bacterium]
MSEYNPSPSIARRVATTLLACGSLLFVAACLFGDTLRPAPGRFAWAEPLFEEFDGAHVNLANGNLFLERRDLELDTWLGPVAIGAVYNSANAQWRWNFAMEHDGKRFTDQSGALHDLQHVVVGTEIPGTHWLKHSEEAVRSRGGLVFQFSGGTLDAVHWNQHDYPRLAYTWSKMGGARQLERIEQCLDAEAACLPLFEMSWDADGRLLSVRDRAARSLRIERDQRGRPIRVEGAADAAAGRSGTHYEYETGATGRLVARTLADGERSEFAYDTEGHLASLRRVGEGDPTTLFAYARADAKKYVTSVTRADGSVRRYRFDATWRLDSRTEADGDTHRTTWQGFHIASVTDPTGAKTRFDRSWGAASSPGLGRTLTITKTTASGNRAVKVFVSGAHNRADPFAYALLSHSDSVDELESRSYDRGRIASLHDGTFTFHFGYGDPGVSSFLPSSGGYAGSYRSALLGNRGEHGHPLRITSASTLSTLTLAAPVYDAVGNLLVGSDISEPTSPGRPGVVSRSFYADRSLAGITYRATSGETAPLGIERRADGQPLAIRRPGGGDTEFDYDALGRNTARRERVDGGWQTTRFEWDAQDRRVATLRPNGMRTETDYDSQGRVVAIRHLKGGVLETVVTNTWERGRLVSQADSSRGGAEHYEYDAAGNRVAIDYPGGERLEFEVDLRGRVTLERFIAANGSTLREIETDLDPAGRRTALREDGEELIVFERGVVPALGAEFDAIRYGNGLVREFEIDEEWNRLARSSTHRDGDLVELTELVFETDCSASVPDRATCLDVYEAALPTSPGAHPAERYEFSGGYGIESGTSVHLVLGRPSSGPRLEADGVLVYAEGFHTARTTYEYDALGNLLARAEEGLREDFVYNAEGNRLLEGGGHSYVYDQAGFTISRDGMAFEWDAQGRIRRVGDWVEAAWDGLGRPLSRTTKLGEVRFLFGGRVEANAAGLPLALDLGDVRLDLVDRSHRYRHFDFRGNVQFETDDAGQVVQSHRYNAYGVVESFDPEGAGPDFARGTGLAGLRLLGARILDADSARFLSPDPVFQVSNQYAYAEGNPVLLWDPNGEFPKVNCKVRVEFPKSSFPWPKVTLECGCGLGFESGIALLLIDIGRRRRKRRRRGLRARA